MSKVLYRAIKYVNTEDVLLAREDPIKEIGKKTLDKTKGVRRPKLETEGTKGAPGPRGEDSQASPH